ncbi:hypothetical protein M9H77_03839 [Catharanthus roseus]|uniref:Uncharacterized protein n=1 Tax=Catharanthus roseus TaxID=4058 RepID=A0ACC0CCD8_CATRO|nr:hypothetical protein M9H77_03839 [Catharanthus roseus]
MLDRYTLALDPVDRGRSTVGGLGPRRFLICIFFHLKIPFPRDLFFSFDCFLIEVAAAKETVTASAIASNAGMKTKIQNTLAPKASSFTKKDDGSSKSNVESSMAEDSTALSLLPVMMTGTLKTEEQTANLTTPVEDLANRTQE